MPWLRSLREVGQVVKFVEGQELALQIGLSDCGREVGEGGRDVSEGFLDGIEQETQIDPTL